MHFEALIGEESLVTENAIIDANTHPIADIQLRERTNIKRQHKLSDALRAEVEVQTGVACLNAGKIGSTLFRQRYAVN